MKPPFDPGDHSSSIVRATAMCKDMCKKYKEGLANLPWTLSVAGAIALLILLLSGNYVGNAIRCAVFDSSGCLPRLDVSVEASHVAPDKIESLVTRKNLAVLDGSALDENDDYSFYRFDIHLTNIGVSNVEDVDLVIAFYPSNKQIGTVITKTQGLQDVKLDKSEYPLATTAYRLKPGYFQPADSLFDNEAFVLTVVSRLAKGIKVSPSDVILELYVQCETCQVRLQRTVILGGDVL